MTSESPTYVVESGRLRRAVLDRPRGIGARLGRTDERATGAKLLHEAAGVHRLGEASAQLTSDSRLRLLHRLRGGTDYGSVDSDVLHAEHLRRLEQQLGEIGIRGEGGRGVLQNLRHFLDTRETDRYID